MAIRLKVGDPITDPKLLTLLGQHKAVRHYGIDVEARIGWNAAYKSKQVEIKIDGDWFPVSLKHAERWPTPREIFSKAIRREIGPILLAFRNRFKTCLCGMPTADAHHKVPVKEYIDSVWTDDLASFIEKDFLDNYKSRKPWTHPLVKAYVAQHTDDFLVPKCERCHEVAHA